MELIAQVELDQVDHVDQRIIRFGGSAVYKVSIEARRGRRLVAWRTKIVHQRERIPLTIPLDGGEPLICVDTVFDCKRGVELHCYDGLNSLMRFFLAFPVEPDNQMFELPLTRRKKLRIEIVRQSAERCSECAPE